MPNIVVLGCRSTGRFVHCIDACCCFFFIWVVGYYCSTLAIDPCLSFLAFVMSVFMVVARAAALSSETMSMTIHA
jgi:hypothetical protein